MDSAEVYWRDQFAASEADLVTLERMLAGERPGGLFAAAECFAKQERQYCLQAAAEEGDHAAVGERILTAVQHGDKGQVVSVLSQTLAKLIAENDQTPTSPEVAAAFRGARRELGVARTQLGYQDAGAVPLPRALHPGCEPEQFRGGSLGFAPSGDPAREWGAREAARRRVAEIAAQPFVGDPLLLPKQRRGHLVARMRQWVKHAPFREPR